MDSSRNKHKFSLATERHEPALRQMLKDNPVSGKISVSFEREPNFFYGASIGNKFRQVLVCQDSDEAKVVGMGMRSAFDAYINGSSVLCGYLGSLRINTNHRSQTVLSRGYHFIHDLHLDGKIKLYLTTIVSDNSYAKGMLTSRRAGLPSYEEYGLLHTYIFPLRRSRNTRTNVTIVKAKDTDLPAVVECLERNGKQKQFYPAYSQEMFQRNDGFLRDFNVADFFLAFRNHRLVGVMGMWDQHAFKQIVIRGYSPLLDKARPLYNCAANFFGLPVFPAIGKDLAMCYAFAIAIDDNDVEVFEQLLTAVHNESGRRRYDYLVLGLHSKDALCRVAKSMPHFLYTSNLYVVHWEDGIKEFNALDHRVPYLEIATL